MILLSSGAGDGKLLVAGVVDLVQPDTAQDLFWELLGLVPLHEGRVNFG